jgi:prepilin-type N-terminal cleavage/methylation domain-containing protein
MKDLAMRLRARAQTAEIEGEEAAEAGFTLIELMVVLLIIAILLAIAIPTFLGVTSTASDRSAQSNLTNAVTESKTLYQVNAAYAAANGGAVYNAASFAAQAPEFTWGANSNCAAATASQNCISFEVVDASSANDSQAVVLAAYSVKTTTCWYAVDLEGTPATITGDTPGVPFDQGKNSSVTTAGVFYGKNTAPGGTCSASQAVDPTTSAAWATNYGAAQTVA